MIELGEEIVVRARRSYRERRRGRKKKNEFVSFGVKCVNGLRGHRTYTRDEEPKRGSVCVHGFTLCLITHLPLTFFALIDKGASVIY